MSAPNRNALWGQVLVEELAAGGLEAVCVSPGSRSTPLTVAFAEHPEITVYAHLDERAAAFFALGRARRTGEPTALVCTSGTAAANYHPAVVEADRGRVPLVVLTADRPPELRDSGANQTVDQRGLYGNAVRSAVDLPEPSVEERTLRMLRTTAARTLTTATGTPAGPVHLNCPFAKPLEPVAVPGDVPDDLEESLAGTGRDGPFVETSGGSHQPTRQTVDRVRRALAAADRPLIVCGPADPETVAAANGDESLADAVTAVASCLDAPVLADPLSTVRFGSHVSDTPVVGGYDAYVDAVDMEPDVVVRTGASPTSKPLRHYLRDAQARQFLVDPAGDWREATFTATDLIEADPAELCRTVASELGDEPDAGANSRWSRRFQELEDRQWTVTDDATEPSTLAETSFEGAVLATVFEAVPAPATVFVSNSMPIRDCDRFARPRPDPLTVLANRGASGIDGITSTALGAGSALDHDEPLVLVTGDLAFYHDLTGLLAIQRCDVDVTIVVVDNDGGGIFHKLPIEEYDPPFTSQFKTPHGLDFEHAADLYDLAFERVEPAAFAEAFADVVQQPGSGVLSVSFDAEASHRRREELADRVSDGDVGDQET